MMTTEEVDETTAEYKQQFEEACALHPGIFRLTQSEYSNVFNSFKPFERAALTVPYGFEAFAVGSKGKMIVDGYRNVPYPKGLDVAMTSLSYMDPEAGVYRRPRVVAGAAARKWLEELKPEAFRDNPITFNGIAIEDGDVPDNVIRLIPHEVGRVMKLASGGERVLQSMDFVVPQGETEFARS